MAEVFWAARDLDGPPLGNHQFILIYLNADESLIRTPAQTCAGQKFVTLGAFKVNGNLVFQANQSSDVKSVREVLDPTTITGWSDFDMEKHRINPPSGGAWGFAVQLEELAYRYRRNSATSPVRYSLFDENCAAWVNTMFKVAGVPCSERLTAGEFSGIDWGEEDLLDENLFR